MLKVVLDCRNFTEELRILNSLDENFQGTVSSALLTPAQEKNPMLKACAKVEFR